jgi:hypothetical protein
MIKSPTIDVSFWFAVFSPLLGVLTGFFALALFYR